MLSINARQYHFVCLHNYSIFIIHINNLGGVHGNRTHLNQSSCKDNLLSIAIPQIYGDEDENRTRIELIDNQPHYQSATPPLFVEAIV